MGEIIYLSVHHFEGFNNKFFALSNMGVLIPSIRDVEGLKFVRLMGTGSGNGFGIWPEFGRYVMLTIWDDDKLAKNFYNTNAEWLEYKGRSHKTQIFHLQCCAVHGKWQENQPFEKTIDYDKNRPLLVITRATIKWLDMIRFWRDVPMVTKRLRSAFKPIYSVGIGEWPLRFQATFSIWKNGE